MRPATLTAAAIIVLIQSTIALVGLFAILVLNAFIEPLSGGTPLTTAPLVLLAAWLVGLVTALGLLGLRQWAMTAAVIFEGANLPILLWTGQHFDASGAASDPWSFLVFLGIFLLLPLAVVGLLFLPRLAR